MTLDFSGITAVIRGRLGMFSSYRQGDGEAYRIALWNKMPGRTFSKCFETLILENVALAEAVWQLQSQVEMLQANDEQVDDEPES